MIELRVLRIGDIEVVEVKGAAGAADDAHFAGVAHFGANLVFHLDFVLVGQDDNAGFGFAFVGDFEFRRIVNTWSDQPRIRVWPCSSTSERPLRRSSILPSMPDVSTPISVLTMKMPPRVTPSMVRRKGGGRVAAHGAGVERAEEATPEIADEISGRYVDAVIATQERPEEHNH